MQGFADYARYLQQPLTLIGFVLLLFFGVHRALLRSGILPPVTATSSSRIVQSLLRYGFIIALAIIVLGFGLELLKTYHKRFTLQDIEKVHTDATNLYLRSKIQQQSAWLNSVSDEERQRVVTTARQIEDVLSRSGMQLSPKELTGLGYAYLVANEPDKSKTMLLDAIKGDPSLVEANELLAAVNQLQANEYLQRNDLDHARELLNAAEEYAKTAQHDNEDTREESFIDNQLGFIYKDMAQRDLSRNDQSRASADLSKAELHFLRNQGVNANDPSSLNGLGSIYYLRGDLEHAIKEQHKALEILPSYTFAWQDLAVDLSEKYSREKPHNKTTLSQLNDALDEIFKLQATVGAQKLPPAHLEGMERLRVCARAEAAGMPMCFQTAGVQMSAVSGVYFNVSGVGNPLRMKAIKTALAQYDTYLRGLGVSVPEGWVEVQILPSRVGYISYYDSPKETIYLNVQYADSTFWPLRDYTVRVLGADPGTELRNSLVPILSGLATYYPSSSRNNPNYGPSFGGQLDKVRSLGDLRPEYAGPDGSSIWGSACWELRTLLDSDAADKLLLQAWRQMGTSDSSQPDAVRFASQIIELHKSSGGTKADTIRLMFERRGLKL